MVNYKYPRYNILNVMTQHNAANTVQMDWFELDKIAAGINMEHDGANLLSEKMEEARTQGEAELTWFELDKIHAACDTQAAEDYTEQFANKLT